MNFSDQTLCMISLANGSIIDLVTGEQLIEPADNGMRIEDQPMDRMVTNDDGDMIHCHQVAVFNDAHDLAGWTGSGGSMAFGFNQTTGEYIMDPAYKVLPWSDRQAILESLPQQHSLI